MQVCFVAQIGVNKVNLVTIENITKSYTERLLFDHASFFLGEGEKVGIIGINGTGKSTLLKMIAGKEEPDTGNIMMANHVVVRYLPQNPVFAPEMTVLEGVLQGNVKEDNHWEMENEANIMLAKLGINNVTDKIGTLSGGQKKRIALVNVLLSPADILVLDEPTNHLDNQMADWLEEILKKWRGALVMVTHDRYFLDSVSNRIVEVDKGQIFSYQTNYSGYIKLKAEREEMLIASERKRQSILRKEEEWMMRGARARSTKQKAHIERYEALRDQVIVTADEKVNIGSVSSRLGRSTVELEHVSKSYDNKPLITDFSYIFLKNDRVGFVGKNGCGKTTLMKMIMGRVQPDFGEIKIGKTVKIGYYTQEIEGDKDAGIAYMNPESKVIDYIRETAEFVQTVDGTVSASAMLERFLFPASQQYSPIGKLSGGEKRRLNLLRVLMEMPNVLVLDEPTNDLDITTLTILEDYLDSFAGVVIIVSHDRYFLDRTVSRIFAFEDGEIYQYEGGYTDYAIRRDQKLEQIAFEEKKKDAKEIKKNEVTADATADAKNQRTREKKLKFSFNEQREYETIDQDIADLEEKLVLLEKDMTLHARDFVKLNEVIAQKEQTALLLEEKMNRWIYLEDLASRIEKEKDK